MKLIVTYYKLLDPRSDEYKQMKQYLLWSGHYHFNVWDFGPHSDRPSGTFEYELDTKNLFDNQVNTVCGKRIHDWADYMPNVHFTAPRHGHYVENLDELNDLRHTYFKCGYCGNMDQVGGWCEKCRGSEYLTPDHHYLLWMRRLTEKTSGKKKVPDAVQASIEAEQKKTTLRKQLKWWDDKWKSLERSKVNAKKQQDFFAYCIDQGLHWNTLQNCIFYDHKDTFCFGWRTPLPKAEAERIATVLGSHPKWKVEYTT